MNQKWNAYELALFLVLVPLMLIGIYLLPAELREVFILNRDVPTILAMFFSNYTHSEIDHLTANLVGYIIVILLIMHLKTDKVSFYKTAAVLFLIAPFIISLLTLAYVPVPRSQGFSGIVLGLIGYFTYVTYRRIRDVWKVDANPLFVWLIFSANAFILALMQWPESFITLAFLTVTIVLLYLNRNALNGVIAKIAQGLKEKPTNLMINSLVFMLSLATLFSLPSLLQITYQEGIVTNVVGHYVGYIIGFLFPLWLIKPKS